MKKEPNTEDVNLLDLFIIIWKGKYKVILISTLIVLAILYNHKNQEIIYTATTQIQKISNNEQLKYENLNSYINLYYSKDIIKKINILKNQNDKSSKDEIKLKKNQDQKLIAPIDRQFLLDLFVEKLLEREIFTQAIKKNNFINKDDYKNNESYENAVLNLAYSIKLFPETNSDGSSYWNIRFKTKDKKEWEKFLSSVNDELNKNINSYLNKLYTQFVKNQFDLKKFAIEDLDLRILNLINGYQKEISYRLAFLGEQATIARTLDISKNINLGTNEIKSLIIDKNVFEVEEKELPYYMRGYQMIEKEIELISNRKDIKPFVNGLSLLESKRRDLMSNKKINRLENIIKNTITLNTSDFVAARIAFMATKYKSNKKSFSKTLILSILIGLIIGFFYVLIENSVRKRF